VAAFLLNISLSEFEFRFLDCLILEELQCSEKSYTEMLNFSLSEFDIGILDF